MDDAPWFPARPRLRPGVRVTRRDDGRHQLGLRPHERVALPHDPQVTRFLSALESGRRPDLTSLAARGWARELVDHDLVVDGDRVAAAMAGPVPRDAVAAAYAHWGPDAEGRLAARSQARIGLRADPPWDGECRRLLDAAGLTVAGPREPETAVLLVNASGEVNRDDLDPWLRDSVSHLLVTNLAARVRVGPFVAPGLTACQRCVDAHGSDLDPGHGLLVEQHRPAPDEPADPLLIRLGLAWAVRDLVAYVEGDLPSTWSTSVELDAGLAAERTAWPRHPRCGCAWGERLAAG